MKFLYRHPGWSLIVTALGVVAFIILVCVAIVVFGAVFIGTIFVIEKIGIKVEHLVFGFVVVVAVFCYLVGVAKGRQE